MYLSVVAGDVLLETDNVIVIQRGDVIQNDDVISPDELSREDVDRQSRHTDTADVDVYWRHPVNRPSVQSVYGVIWGQLGHVKGQGHNGSDVIVGHDQLQNFTITAGVSLYTFVLIP